jgi:trehalose synthase
MSAPSTPANETLLYGRPAGGMYRRRGGDRIQGFRRQQYSWLNDYLPMIGAETVERISRKAEVLAGMEVQHVNSTKQGGGVTEILRSLVPLMTGIGIRAHWNSIVGPPSFYDITKSLHNMLQGKPGDLSLEEWRHYEETVSGNAAIIDIRNDFVVVHDPQPLPLILHRRLRRPWLWRCHLDLSNLNKAIWDRLAGLVERYDGTIFSMPEYAQEVAVPTHFMMPAIDPFTLKNRPQEEEDCRRRLAQYGIPDDLPIVAQVSRFDPWKDPLGVIEAARIARKEVDFTLVLLGNLASDDPEGIRIYESLLDQQDERTLILIDGGDQLLVSAVQHTAAVILQKSVREGFGLTVAEAMWKSRPVIGGRVGGIVKQIEDGVSGFLVSSPEETAARIVQVLSDPNLASRLGENACHTVQKKFLMPRLLEQYLDLFSER